MKKLVIAEKPSVGRDIAKVLNCRDYKDGYIEGPDYVVTWAVGHLVGLKYPEEHNSDYKKWVLEDLPLIFPIQNSLKVLPNTAKQFKIVKSLIHRSDISEIINAGDAGREGYLIQKWTYRLAGNKKPEKVLWASSFTDEAIRKHINNLKDDSLFVNLLQEAECRAEVDNILGINYSRVLTLTKGNGKDVLSYGRCQTPLLNQVVLRDEEIENFVSKPYYNVEAYFDKEYKGILITDKDKKERVDFENKNDAENIQRLIENKKGFVLSYKKEEKKKAAPLLYNLTALQKAMDSKYGFTPDETLNIAQDLYEKHKILSYPRTSSQYLSMDLYNEIQLHLKSCSFGDFKKYIDKIDFSRIKADKRYFNDLKVTDHHALIPTINNSTESIYNKLNDKEKKVFDCVVLSLIAIFFPDYEYYSIEVLTEVEKKLFLSKGTIPKLLGYKEVIENDPDEKKNEDEQKIPYLNNNEEVICEKSEVLDKMTKPPSRFTSNSLLALMEKNKIGTDATRAEIIKKLLKRGFLKMDKRKYISTPLGREFIKVIPDELKDVKLTSNFEEKLSLINDGKLNKQTVVDEIVTELKSNIKIFQQNSSAKIGASSISGNDSLGTCPCCGNPIIENSKAYGCSNYKNGCEFTIWKTISGKNITKTIVKQLLQNQTTSKIKGFKSKVGKEYEAYLKLEEDGKTANGSFKKMKVSISFETKNETNIPQESNLICPKCKNHLINDRWAYKCNCGFSLSKNICQRDLKEKELEVLLKNGKSEKLDGFTSKAGKKFSAYLVLNGDKVEFSFN